MPVDQKNIFIPPGRLSRVLTFRCSLYRPTRLAARTSSIFDSGEPADTEGVGGGYAFPPDYTNVPCYLEATPELGEVTPLGINKEQGVFTSDRWWFLAEQEINDVWLIVMTASQSPSTYIGRAWITQGNTEILSSGPGRGVDSQWIFAKLSPTRLIPSP